MNYRVNKDKAIADAYGNRFYISLEFYQSALGDRLEYEIIFNDYNQVVVATGSERLYLECMSLWFHVLFSTCIYADIWEFRKEKQRRYI